MKKSKNDETRMVVREREGERERELCSNERKHGFKNECSTSKLCQQSRFVGQSGESKQCLNKTGFNFGTKNLKNIQEKIIFGVFDSKKLVSKECEENEYKWKKRVDYIKR